MADDELTETIYYIDAWGHKQTLRVTRADALAVRRVRAVYKRAIERWERTHVSFTDLDADGNGDIAVPASKSERIRQREDYLGLPWEGPLFRFDRFLGVGPTWPLAPRPDGRCPGCAGRKLGLGEMCLVCERTGRDLAIPVPTRADLEKRREPKRKLPAADDGLSGGVGKAKPKPKAPTEKQLAKERDRKNRAAKKRRARKKAAKYGSR